MFFSKFKLHILTISGPMSIKPAIVAAEKHGNHTQFIATCCENGTLFYVVSSRRLHRKFENIKNENFPLALSVTMVPVYQCNFWRRICLNCIRISMDGKTFYHQKNFKWIWVDPGFRDLWRLNNKSKCYFNCSTLFGECYEDSGSNRTLWFKFLLGNYWCFDIKGQQELIVVCVTQW